jgi:hypothetical protein
LWTHAVVDFERTALDDDPHAKAVGDTDAGRVRTGIARVPTSAYMESVTSAGVRLSVAVPPGANK